MKSRDFFRAVSWVLGVGVLSGIAAGADYAGTYGNESVVVMFVHDGAGYGGKVHTGGETYPLTAREEGDHLVGSYVSGATTFLFTATRQGDDLTVVSDGTVYAMRREGNPLAAAQPVNPPAGGGGAPTTGPAVQGTEALVNYVPMISNDVGRSLVREIPNVTTTEGALQGTFPDLAKFFGGRPTILGAYEDQRDHRSAFVSFSAQWNGAAVKGFVTTKVRDGGAVVFVVFGKADATRAEWATLTARPAAAGGEGSFDDQMAAVPLTPYAFSDGTGAIGLAEGYTTNAQTESNLTIKGPSGQTIRMALGGTVYLPENLMVRQNPRWAASVPVAPYSDDLATALASIIRADSLVSQRKGGPALEPERLIKLVPIPSSKPGAHAGQVTYDVTTTERGSVTHNRVLIQLEVSRPTIGLWGYYVSLQLIAPQETFKQDLPVMMAQAFSLSENAAAVRAKSAREIAAANAHAAAQRDANQKVADAHYAYTRNVEQDETIKMRSITDFDETIRGERTVEDTQTGEQGQVNLADVHTIVDNLNAQDPGRYREIPLRDQFFPMAGHGNDPDYVGR